MPDPAAARRSPIALRAISRRVAAARIGDPLYYCRRDRSTNDVAAALAEPARRRDAVVAACADGGAGPPRPGVVLAAWCGLYMSVVIRSLRRAVADAGRWRRGCGRHPRGDRICRSRSSGRTTSSSTTAGRRAAASWPAFWPRLDAADGLQHVILGIGINVRPAAYPPELADRASSIETELGRPVDAGPSSLPKCSSRWPRELEPLDARRRPQVC